MSNEYQQHLDECPNRKEYGDNSPILYCPYCGEKLKQQ